MPQGTTILDFGIAPGKSDVTLQVAQPAITAGQLAEAWLFPAVTASHNVDDHIYEEIQVTAHSVVAGVGFSITARTRNKALTGAWSVGWVYN